MQSLLFTPSTTMIPSRYSIRPFLLSNQLWFPFLFQRCRGAAASLGNRFYSSSTDGWKRCINRPSSRGCKSEQARRRRSHRPTGRRDRAADLRPPAGTVEGRATKDASLAVEGRGCHRRVSSTVLLTTVIDWLHSSARQKNHQFSPLTSSWDDSVDISAIRW